ncbi:MAG: hypothetical protein ACTSRI_06315 [Promethearchaeota archaeon]
MLKKKIKLKLKLNQFITKRLIIVVIPWIILAVIFGMFDLEISKAVINEINHIWGTFGANYGAAPGYGLIGISIAVLAGCLHGYSKKQKIPALIIIFIGIMIFLIGIVDSDQEWMINGASLAISLTIFVVITLNKDYKEYKTISIAIFVLAVLNPLIITQITNILCGRVIFNDLASDYSNYTPWFLPPGISLEHHSFISGAAAMGWMFLPLMEDFRCRSNGLPVRIIVIVLVIGWGSFVTLSLVVSGVNYASDVLFSTGIAFCITLMCHERLSINRQ